MPGEWWRGKIWMNIPATPPCTSLPKWRPGGRSRGTTVEFLSSFLRDWQDQDPEFNAFVISRLMDLNATEAAPLMAAAFEAGAVDLSVAGDWEDVQVHMGLLPRRITPRVSNFPFKMHTPSAPPAEAAPRRGRSQKTENRRKDARAARKRNRRK